MAIHYGRSQLKTPLWIFDLTDRFARDMGVNEVTRPFGPLQIYVIGEQINGVDRTWSRPLRLITAQNPSGHLIFFGQLQDSQKPYTKRRNYLQDSHIYRLRFESQYYQTIERDFPFAEVPANPRLTLDLEPGYAYPFPRLTNYHPTLLRSHVHAADGTGIPHIQIAIIGQNIGYEMTDQTGQWLLAFPDGQPAGNITVNFIRNGAVLAQSIAAIQPGQANVLPPVQLNV
jgi:hypothetical protein